VGKKRYQARRRKNEHIKEITIRFMYFEISGFSGIGLLAVAKRGLLASITILSMP